MKPILVFQTDFTYKEGAVSSMYGVVKWWTGNWRLWMARMSFRSLTPGAPATVCIRAFSSGRKEPYTCLLLIRE